MKLSEICINRPVFSTVLSLLIILVGMISYLRLDVREYPNIDPPIATVTSNYTGASPEIMETDVTNVLEEYILSVSGIKSMTSTNSQGLSQISVEFIIGTDIDVAANELRDRVGRARNRLPKSMDQPVVTKTEADSDPIMYLSVSSAAHTQLEISRYADTYIKDPLQTINGTASVLILGERKYAMKVSPDPIKMAALGVTVIDIRNLLSEQNAQFPAGLIEGQTREFNVLAKFDVHTEEDFRKLIVKKVNNYIVRLEDVAEVKIGAEDDRLAIRFNGVAAQGIGIIKQSDANPLDVANAVREKLPEIQDSLPPGMNISVAYDKSVFIKSSIKAVYKTIAEALVLVILIILFFLKSFRSLIIPSVAIPVSLIGAFAFMYMFNFSINSFTLLALVLAIGLVVDDAIVVIENIFRHIENGMEKKAAAKLGSSEIGFAIIAMTLTLAAVFVPIGFMPGQTGKLFTEFAWTLALAVIVSGFVALTLTPMMCSKLLTHEKRRNKIYNQIEKILDYINSGYKRTLDIALINRKFVLVVLFVVFMSSFVIAKFIPSELAPTEDRGVILTVFFAEEGAGLEYTEKYSRYLESIYKGVKEINSYFIVVGRPNVNQGVAFALLDDWSERKRSQMDIVSSIFPEIFGIPGIMAFPINLPSISNGGENKPLHFVIQTDQTYEKLGEISKKFLAHMKDKYPWINSVESDLKLNEPRIQIDINRERAASMGVSIADIGSTLQILIGSDNSNVYDEGGKQYYVIIQMDRFKRLDPNVLETIYVKSNSGAMVKLSNLVTFTETVSPLELNHYNRLRAVSISANLSAGHVVGEAVDAVKETAKAVLDPADGKIEFLGQADQYLQASYSTYVTFGLALVFIYLVLAAQFESFRDPFIIMLTVPLSITGALLALYFTGGTLNIYSKIGLITLIGLITKNGILIVEFTNQQMDEGQKVLEAVRHAAQLRLRPILMTTCATILGAVPLAIASGPGAVSRNNIGWVIVGGLAIGTLFTLYVIPVACVIFKGHEVREKIE